MVLTCHVLPLGTHVCQELVSKLNHQKCIFMAAITFNSNNYLDVELQCKDREHITSFALKHE